MGSTIQPNFGANAFRTTFKSVEAAAPRSAGKTAPAAPGPAAVDTFESPSGRKQGVNLTGAPPVVTVMPAVDLSPPPATYTVKQGDTGYSIARELGVSLEALRNANPEAGGLVSGSGEFLSIGDTLNVPSNSPSTQSATVPVTPVVTQTTTEATTVPAVVTPANTPTTGKYSVVPDDNASVIAQKLGVSVQALIAANPGAEGLVKGSGKYIYPGQQLEIPGPPPPALAQAPADSPDLTDSQAMVDAGASKQEAYGKDSTDSKHYNGKCLSFVADTAGQAGQGDPILDQPNAATALYEAQRQGRLYADTSNMPAGAVVFWPATGNNGDQGHVAIYTGRDDANGDPIMLTSTGFGGTEENPTISGVQEMTLSRLNELEATGSAGWMMPR